MFSIYLMISPRRKEIRNLVDCIRFNSKSELVNSKTQLWGFLETGEHLVDISRELIQFEKWDLDQSKNDAFKMLEYSIKNYGRGNFEGVSRESHPNWDYATTVASAISSEFRDHPNSKGLLKLAWLYVEYNGISMMSRHLPGLLNVNPKFFRQFYKNNRNFDTVAKGLIGALKDPERNNVENCKYALLEEGTRYNADCSLPDDTLDLTLQLITMKRNKVDSSDRPHHCQEILQSYQKMGGRLAQRMDYLNISPNTSQQPA